MNPFLISGVLVLAGLLAQIWWLTGIGVIGVLLSLTTVYSREPPAPSGGKTTYKLLQAAPDSWDDDEILTYYSAMAGPKPLGTQTVEDPMKVLSKKGIPSDVLRNTLPFQGYGRKSVFEQLFIGLPVNLGTLIKKK